MKTFVDQETGQRFQLGSRGMGALKERISNYAEQRRQEGAREVALYPNNIPEGAKFKCSACDQVFEFDGKDQDAFINGIMEHGRAHGACEILPVV